MSLFYFAIFLFILYAAVVIYCWWAWNRVPVFQPSTVVPPTLTVSVIIPARNEEDNIGKLLESLQRQSYPAHLTEIIVVDDHSTDRTAEIVSAHNTVRLLRLTEEGINSYKKKALATGVAAAHGELIITTDADCSVPADWISLLAAFYIQYDPVFVAAPVVIDGNSSVLEVFQSMDFMILQGITGAASYRSNLTMCNGANLSYKKEAFAAVNGFADIDDIASGDDMLLMHKMTRRFPGKVLYLKSQDIIVHTEPAVSWEAFFQQRIRWASKARKYKDPRLFPVLLLVYLFNLLFPIVIITALFYPFYWWVLLGLWIAKTLVEWPLLISTASFFNKAWSIRLFPVFQPLHIAYTIIAGLLGQAGRYSWKGRRIK